MQTRIQSPVQHLAWNIKAPSQIFDGVSNTPVLCRMHSKLTTGVQKTDLTYSIKAMVLFKKCPRILILSTLGSDKKLKKTLIREKYILN